MRGLLTGLLGGSIPAVLPALFAGGVDGAGTTPTKAPQIQTLPPLREQAELIDAWTEERKALIPGLLRKYGVDAWLMSQREYAEDTVFWALKEATQFSARRRTTHLFVADPSPPGAPSAYAWVENTDAVWADLRRVLAEQAPASVALNTHSEIAFSGGLHAGEREAITAHLGREWEDRFVLRPMLAVEVVATMVPGRLPWYRKMQETAWAIIEEAFSERIIVPGKSTSWDVEWWMREKIQSLNYTTWFQPSVFIVTEDDFPAAMRDDPRAPDHIIQYGDLIHTDFGVSALELNTDTQHLGYVLNPGETEADVPQGMIDGLKKVNRLQDIVKDNMKIGMTGNEILKASLEQMHDEGIEGKIYCHPTGEWGHSAGTVIGKFASPNWPGLLVSIPLLTYTPGMTNLQDGVPVLGDLPLLKNTYYSIELFAEHFVPERNRTLKFAQEEDVYWDNETNSWEWVYGRQEEFLLVRTPAEDASEEPAEL
ncbi:putative lipoprotein [Biscogniauxia marginata]|nr:putative lipoprotein [Biscogniauxia marginata]